MTKDEMSEMLDSIPPLLNRADEPIEHAYDSAKAIGSLIVAIDRLREVVKELVEQKASAK